MHRETFSLMPFIVEFLNFFNEFCYMSFHGATRLELPIMVYVVHIKLLSKNCSSSAIKHGLFITCNHVIKMTTCKMHDINLIIE